jgi:hypothetical protein
LLLEKSQNLTWNLQFYPDDMMMMMMMNVIVITDEIQFDLNCAFLNRLQDDSGDEKGCL